MPYRLRYTWNIDWVPSGIGPWANPVGAGGSNGPGASNNQTLGGIDNANTANLTVVGSGTASPAGNQIATGDITTLTTAMASDVSTQANAVIGRLQGFATGLG
jgi:hypothetical protein